MRALASEAGAHFCKCALSHPLRRKCVAIGDALCAGVSGLRETEIVPSRAPPTSRRLLLAP